MSEQAVQVGRFYTATRRIQTLIGELNGTRLPGGPYTLVQFTVGIGALIVGYLLTKVVSTGWGVLDVVVVAGAGWGAALLAGKVPHTRRNPLWVIRDAVGAVGAPAQGRLGGAAFVPARPHRAIPLVPAVWDAPGPRGEQEASTPPPGAAVPAPERRSGAPHLTPFQALIAHIESEENP